MRIDNLSIEAKTMLNDFVNQLEYDLIERKEDKKIEKIKKKEEITGIVEGITYRDNVYNLEDIGNKINEIIDCLNKEK